MRHLLEGVRLIGMPRGRVAKSPGGWGIEGNTHALAGKVQSEGAALEMKGVHPRQAVEHKGRHRFP